MRFNPKARIDSGKVSGSRGGGGGGGMRLPMPTGRAAGGGGMAIVVVILLFLLQQCAGINVPVVPGGGDSQGSSLGDSGPDAYDECRTGADANRDEACARKAVALSLEKYWSGQVEGFRAAPIVTFCGQVSTRCGTADSAVGPFYCPGDLTIYLDPTFFDDVLEERLGGKGGDFVEPYVLGHEYGHHIQRITGQMENVRTQQGPDSDAVKLELQADCYAGLWARAAESTQDDSGVAIFSDIDDADIQEALSAAYTVGDDHIQEVTGARVDTGSWTHGSSEQRMEWFRRGFDSGDYQSCNIW